MHVWALGLSCETPAASGPWESHGLDPSGPPLFPGLGLHHSGPHPLWSKNSKSKKLAEVEIGRSRNWPKSNWPNSKKKAGLSRNWPKSIALATTAHCVFYAPPGVILSTTQVDVRVDSCHSPSTSASAHEVGHPHPYQKPHTQKQFTSFINISDLSLVRCFVPKSVEFVSEGIFSTVSLLSQTASWSHKYWISMCFALPN